MNQYRKQSKGIKSRTRLVCDLPKIFYLVVMLFAASVTQADVSATFTVAGIAEYNNNANQNTDPVSISDSTAFAKEGSNASGEGLKSVTISQIGDEWGGTQGNDVSVVLTVTFSDDSTAQADGALNWVLNKNGGGIHYFGVTFDNGTGPAEGFILRNQGYSKTYILPLPGEEQVLTDDIAGLDTRGSANFNAGTIQDLIDALTVAFPPASVSISSVSSATEVEGTDLVHSVTLSAVTEIEQGFTYSVEDVSATGDSDYSIAPTFSDGVTLSNGTLTVPAG
ncbi:MAG: hypothetical protein VW879_14200, partial [Opitutae bacterium]